MNNYKEVSFLISSLFVIYFFKDIITTLIILVILSSISLLLIKADYEKTNDDYSDNNYNKRIETNINNQQNQIQQNTPTTSFKKSSDFLYNR